MNRPTSLDKVDKSEIPGRIDPRIKLILLIILVTEIIFIPEERQLGFLCLFIYMSFLAACSRLPIKILLKRLAAIAPFILFLLLLRLIFYPQNLPQQISFILFLALRTGLIVSAFTIFFHTTPFPHLVKGLISLKVPSLVLTIYFFTHNFIHIILREGESIRRTWQSRSSGKMSLKVRIRAGAILVRQLSLNILHRSEFIYISMVSRGYERHIPFLHLEPIRFIDIVILFLLLVIAGVIILLP
jgi:energy-coupling factor transporter transmembrane protein EcfT